MVMAGPGERLDCFVRVAVHPLCFDVRQGMLPFQYKTGGYLQKRGISCRHVFRLEMNGGQNLLSSSHFKGQKNMNIGDENPIPKFTLKEKVFAQFTYNSGVWVAAYGLYLNNARLGIGYLLCAYFGIFLLVRYTICPRCPHLHAANDCVNLPAFFMKKIISKQRKGPLNTSEKCLFVTVLYGTLIFPVYWLSSNAVLMTAFIVLFGGHLLSLKLHFCKNCENKVCIQNKRG